MKDKIITTKTAKLAAKHNYKDSVDKGWFYYSKQYKSEYWTNTKGGTSGVEDCYKKPTQSLLQKWLREKHNIHIRITDVDSATGVVFHCMVLNYNKEPMEYKIIPFSSKIQIPGLVLPKIFTKYEQALEIGLQEALKML